MTTTTAQPSVSAPSLPDQEELIRRLLSDTPLLKDTPDHLLQVVNVLESYGIVLDAYSKNLVDQGQKHSFPVFRFFHEGLSNGSGIICWGINRRRVRRARPERLMPSRQ